MPTRETNRQIIHWEVYSFGGIRAPDEERVHPFSFRACFQLLMNYPGSAIRIGDKFLLAHYPVSGEIRFSSFDRIEVPNHRLSQVGHQALFFEVVEQLLAGKI